MANRQYVGARYVPKFADPVEWNNALSYEALTIVTHLGNSFTSKKPVPAGVDIGNGEYWVNTGNYNEQVAAYANQVAAYANDVTTLKGKTVTGVLPEKYGAVGDGVTDDTAAIKSAIAECKANGKVLWLTGNYKITSPVGNIGSISITGLGSKITSTYEGSEPLFTCNAPKVQNVNIISNKNHTSAIFKCTDWNNAVFDHINLYYGKCGIELDGTGSNSFLCTISNFNISDANETGIGIKNCADVNINNGVINKCHYGIKANGLSGLYLCGVDIISCGTAFRGEFYTANSQGWFFSNTLFDTSDTTNFSTAGINGYTISNVHFSNSWFSNSHTDDNVYLSGCVNVQMNACSIIYAKKYGLTITDCKNVKVNGCTFFANSISNCAHIRNNNSEGTIINGCTLGGQGDGVFATYKGFRPIELNNSTNSIITSNRAYDNVTNEIQGNVGSDVVKNNIGIADV